MKTLLNRPVHAQLTPFSARLDAVGVGSPASSETEEKNAATAITVARGDGIGPEIMEAVLKILDEADAGLEFREIKIGKTVYEAGHTSGIEPGAWDVIRETGVLLKSPITTPQGGGYKSLNVTLRKTLGLYANVRPCRSYSPYVPTHYPDMDVVIIRENEEDTYAGIEHRQTDEVVQCLKLITRPGCERIVRYAFEYARAYGRKKVTCMTKDNIMKHTDGLFHKVFDEVAEQYPDMESDHLIIDIGAAHMATNPDRFDVIVTPNLYGDIISDISAQVAGSVGLAGSANIGAGTAMFEAIHGSAPDIAGLGIANPSALLRGAVLMLVHMGKGEKAGMIKNAWLKTLEDGVHTADVYREGSSTRKVGTMEFARAVIDRFGERPEHLAAVDYSSEAGGAMELPEPKPTVAAKKELVGIDIFVDSKEDNRDPNALGAKLEAACVPEFKLKMITNRGVKVYPGGQPETFCTDHWRCRFVAADGVSLKNAHLPVLQAALVHAGVDIIKTENLYRFDGETAYSLGQGE
jgi:isocitrate dehydrogenase